MPILSHITVGTNDPAKATEFYSAVLSPLGINLIDTMPNGTSMFGAEAGPEFFVGKPRNGEPATHANGGTIGLKAGSRAAVDQFHAAAMAKGGSDEGAPGPRDFAPNAYAAYVRDPDGNKLVAVCFAPA